MIHIDPILSVLSNFGITDISPLNVMKIWLTDVFKSLIIRYMLDLGVIGSIFGKTSLGFLILSKLFQKMSLGNFL